MTHDRQRRRWQLGGLLGAVAIFVAACAPLPPATPTEANISEATSDVTVITDGRTEISVEENDGQIVLDVRSDTGIGSADVSGLNAEARHVLLRLHVSGLEQFRFVYASTEIDASVSSNSDFAVTQSIVDQAGTRTIIDAESPYWLTIDPISSDGQQPESIPLENGYFQITPPVDLASARPDSFSFSWIDFYR